MSDDSRTRELMHSVSLIMRALLVAGRSGAPAEGKMPFNPLYFNILRSVNESVAIRPSHLAEAMSVSRTTMSTAIKALQKRDLLETVTDENDRRAVLIQLSNEGKEVLEAINRQDMKNSEVMLSLLDDTERDQFTKFMKKIADGLKGSKSDR